MLFFNRCPKCHGDMYVNRDVYVTIIECLQCGMLRDVERNQVPHSVNNPHLVGPSLEGLSGRPQVLRLSA